MVLSQILLVCWEASSFWEWDKFGDEDKFAPRDDLVNKLGDED